MASADASRSWLFHDSETSRELSAAAADDDRQFYQHQQVSEPRPSSTSQSNAKVNKKPPPKHESTHDDSSAFENFLQQMRTPVATRRRQPEKPGRGHNLSSFVVGDDKSPEEEADENHSPGLECRVDTILKRTQGNVTCRKGKAAGRRRPSSRLLTSDNTSVDDEDSGTIRRVLRPQQQQPDWMTDDDSDREPATSPPVLTTGGAATAALFDDFASLSIYDAGGGANYDDDDVFVVQPSPAHQPPPLATAAHQKRIGPLTSSPYDDDSPLNRSVQQQPMGTPATAVRKPKARRQPLLVYNDDGSISSGSSVVRRRKPGAGVPRGVMPLIARNSTHSYSDDDDDDSSQSTSASSAPCDRNAGGSQAERTFLRSLNASAHGSHTHNPTAKVRHRVVHPHSRLFVGSRFKKAKSELAGRLFAVFNANVFDGKLPADTPIQWNARLRKTAGQCVYRRQMGERVVRIELSTKVCDSADRVRDTLLHELCHAANWIIDGHNGGHGPLWKRWAAKAMRLYPDLPLVARCHSYTINAKYVYVCDNADCAQQIKRHSKSLDVARKVCGRCRGRFVLRTATTTATSNARGGGGHTTTSADPGRPPKPPSQFALYVKQHYASVKQSSPGLPHRDIMRTLASQYKQRTVAQVVQVDDD